MAERLPNADRLDPTGVPGPHPCVWGTAPAPRAVVLHDYYNTMRTHVSLDRMHPSNVRLKPPDASERSLSSADSIINTSGSDLRQGHLRMRGGNEGERSGGERCSGDDGAQYTICPLIGL